MSYLHSLAIVVSSLRRVHFVDSKYPQITHTFMFKQLHLFHEHESALHQHHFNSNKHSIPGGFDEFHRVWNGSNPNNPYQFSTYDISTGQTTTTGCLIPISKLIPGWTKRHCQDRAKCCRLERRAQMQHQNLLSMGDNTEVGEGNLSGSVSDAGTSTITQVAQETSATSMGEASLMVVDTHKNVSVNPNTSSAPASSVPSSDTTGSSHARHNKHDSA
ncbi:hypothetical protein K474DRAFT_1680238 [Panus rudis PR-1116 ss-1]|nr:hypothetical protein K474DRAFT_1680238 [Panus rudis PR-1116 ss-1]